MCVCVCACNGLGQRVNSHVPLTQSATVSAIWQLLSGTKVALLASLLPFQHHIVKRCVHIVSTYVYTLYIISVPMGVLWMIVRLCAAKCSEGKKEKAVQGNMVAYGTLVVCTLQRLSPHTTPVTLWVALSNIILSLF